MVLSLMLHLEFVVVVMLQPFVKQFGPDTCLVGIAVQTIVQLVASFDWSSSLGGASLGLRSRRQKPLVFPPPDTKKAPSRDLFWGYPLGANLRSHLPSPELDRPLLHFSPEPYTYSTCIRARTLTGTRTHPRTHIHLEIQCTRDF